MSIEQPRLRGATVGDLSAIMVLESSIFANDAWSSHSMRRELQNPNCVYLVAVAGVRADGAESADPDEVIGYAGLLAPRGSGEADIQTIAVAPEARRSGIGGTLMRTLMHEAVARGAKELFLEVRADNPTAQRLYRELGFEEIGVRARYYQPDDVDALVMRAHLGADLGTAAAPGDQR
jgi:ribosomal-protein-alanine N-acetyltransferase